MTSINQISNFCKSYIKGDPVIWAIAFLLSMLSILVVYSATGTLAYKSFGGNTEYFLFKQCILVSLCFLAIWIAHRLNYAVYARFSKVLLLVSVMFLIYAQFAGLNINNATRWIEIPFIKQQFQPSDLASFALIIALSSMLAKKQQDINNFKMTLMPMMFVCGIVVSLIALSNMSSAILLLSTCLLLIFIGRVSVKYIFILIFIGVIGLGAAILIGERGATVGSRIERFFNKDDIPFQAEQSYIAIANGKVLGTGPGQSSQKNFLPHPYSDFVFAIIVEEYGLIGGLFVLALYIGLLYRGMVTTHKSERPFGGLLSAGLSFALVIQALVNMGVAVGLGPITGLPLPFLSMGGTSLIFTGLSIGIILSVSRGEKEELNNQQQRLFG